MINPTLDQNRTVGLKLYYGPTDVDSGWGINVLNIYPNNCWFYEVGYKGFVRESIEFLEKFV